MKTVDMVVIGTGPAGQRAAIQAAKLGRSVVIIERNSWLGGVCINSGTVPSKALREAVIHLTGIGQRALYGESYSVKQDVTFEDLIYRSEHVMRNERDVIRGHMMRNGVDLMWGEARFEDKNTIKINRLDGADMVRAENIILAVGTAPSRPKEVPFDDLRVVDSDGFLKLRRIPKSIIIVGGGVIGVEYACMMAALGVRVILTEAREKLLEFCDSEIIEALHYHMRNAGITLRLGERVEQIKITNSGLVEALLESGKHLRAETLLYSIGRQGATARLGLENVGIKADERGRVPVGPSFQTEVPNIYAVGDVVGFPALASTSMEQGRLAACHACGEETTTMPELFPYGIYAIPEVSMCGMTEAQLTKAGIPYEAGIAQYKETARGQLIGDEAGMLKLLIHEENRQLLGVHVIGTGATELIHIGQAVMSFNGTVDYFINSIFNYPTLAECYKVAALNGSNKLRLLEEKTVPKSSPMVGIPMMMSRKAA